MPTKKQYKLYGVIIDDICFLSSASKKEVKHTLQRIYGIDNIKNLSEHEMWEFTTWIISSFASLYGIEIPINFNYVELKDTWS